MRRKRGGALCGDGVLPPTEIFAVRVGNSEWPSKTDEVNPSWLFRFVGATWDKLAKV